MSVFRRTRQHWFMRVVRREHIRLQSMNAGAGDPRVGGGGLCAAVAVGIQRGLLAEEVRVEYRAVGWISLEGRVIRYT